MSTATVERDIEKAITLLNRTLDEVRGAGTEIRGARGRRRGRKRIEGNGGKAAELYKEGRSVSDVAQKMGVSYPTAKRMIVSGGAKIRSREERAAARRIHFEEPAA